MRRTLSRPAPDMRSEAALLQRGSRAAPPLHAPRFSHNFSSVPIRAKLKVGAANDAFEREADRVADEVMKTPDARVQRKCGCGGSCGDCSATEEDKPADGSSASTGAPLDPATRAFMEPRFGHDFTNVRVHTGTKAEVPEIAASAGEPLPSTVCARAEHLFRAGFGEIRVHHDAAAASAAAHVAARAFTIGHDIYFGTGRYAPNTRDGATLIGHELGHVVQQRNGLSQADVQHGGDRLEQEADAAGAAFIGRRPSANPTFRIIASSPQPTSAPLQMQPLTAPDRQEKKEPLDLLIPHVDAKQWEEWGAMAAVKKAIADKIAHEYMNRNAPASALSIQPPVFTTPSSQQHKWDPSTKGSTAPAATTFVARNPKPLPLTEARVSLALQRSFNKIKNGKGDELSDWKWIPSPEGDEKTAGEKMTDVAQWGATEGVKKLAETWAENRWPASPQVAEWGPGAAKLLPKYLAKQELYKAANLKLAKITINLVGGDTIGNLVAGDILGSLISSDIFATLAIAAELGGPVIGLLFTAWSVIELFQELGKRKEPSEDERIVAEVRRWLQERDQAKADADAYQKAGRPRYAPIRNPVDNTVVSPFTYPH